MQISIIDAFTERPFAGNPAAVCLLPDGDWPEERWLRQVAREMNLSETAFVRRLPDGDWALRWFTPMTEVPLCGHGTLAATHALRTGGLVAAEPVRFHTLSGVLTATPRPDGRIALDLPTAALTETAVPDGLAEALGSAVLSCRDTGGLGILVAELGSEHAVRGLAPDLAAITRQPARGVAVTARAEDREGGYDFVSRYFAPAAGVAEDPVTGSAHTALTPFWAERLGRTGLTGYQASVRGGLLDCELLGDRVRLAGHAVTVVEGTLRAHPR
ncbi:PhzF family phenazine biosynthesis protein [Kitasatospora acidiphila]|uniref:PhzF family phenazine biosynthesis protein n=1 Tax=Kitasatospora acidiphila TaxID=2567942 RepID=A0A540WBY1_9ACTN|nr:PhzF family phenazine biosynthesis protein [Kitasatospora acidiphila]TQF06551.1 PhzF family phenazine biosynthesis protein [Kitasatospora acidiphila]